MERAKEAAKKKREETKKRKLDAKAADAEARAAPRLSADVDDSDDGSH